MKLIKALIIDDEKTARDGLAAIIAREHPEVGIAGVAGGVEEGFRQITQLSPELVFLDIMMGDGSGFDLLKKFEKISFKVIFVTAFDDYTLEAIRFSALDYLLKPVNTRELKEALHRFAESRSTGEDIEIKLKAFINNYNEGEKTRKKVVLKTTDSIYLVPVSEIVRCEAYNNYSWIYRQGQPRLLISKPLKHFESMLEDYGFIRIHQSHLINISHLTRIDKVDGGMVVLSDGIPLPISTRKREQVFRMLENL